MTPSCRHSLRPQKHFQCWNSSDSPCRMKSSQSGHSNLPLPGGERIEVRGSGSGLVPGARPTSRFVTPHPTLSVWERAFLGFAVAWVARHRRVAVARMARRCGPTVACLPRRRSLTAASSPETAASPPQLPETHSHNPNPPKPPLLKPAHWPFPTPAPIEPPVHAPGVVA